jgi:GNAT superfamily N-acetyltransferase
MRARFEPAKLLLEYQDAVSGMPATCAVVAIYPEYPAPVGVLWYRHTMANLIEILNVYTHEFYRRRGVATAMLFKLRQWYPKRMVCTAHGNHRSTPWLVKNGFTHQPHGWFLTKISVAKQSAPTRGRRRRKAK